MLVDFSPAKRAVCDDHGEDSSSKLIQPIELYLLSRFLRKATTLLRAQNGHFCPFQKAP